ncbi:MAG: hypothetical protein Kow00133_10070 [Amphiplicatus sp.]
MTRASNEKPKEEKGRRPAAPAGGLAAGGALAGFGALLGASCCVAPLVLVNLGVSSAAAANLAWLAQARIWLLGAALVFLAASAVMIWRAGRRPSTLMIAAYGATALLVVAALVLPAHEAALLRLLGLR